MSLQPEHLLGLLLQAPGYLPERASSVAEGVDRLFGFIFWLSAFFLALIVGLTVLFVVRYRARPSRQAPEPSPDHDNRLELFWTGVPLALVLVIFAWSTHTWLGMTEPTAGGDPVRVQVTGRKWSWYFDHPGGKGSKELHLVQNRPAELVLASTDVIHSFYVPDFRLKMDAVPGRFNRLAFTPILAGSFPVLCAEYCGTNHSQMLATVVVHPDQASFDAWAAEGGAATASLLEVGKLAYDDKGCSACHSVDGSEGVGPTFKGLWGRTERLVGGGTAVVDENYVRESILEPGARLVEGYDDVMPPTPLDDREIQGIVTYLRSLGETR
jgi:cytochrome c oxidase subunit 2